MALIVDGHERLIGEDRTTYTAFKSALRIRLIRDWVAQFMILEVFVRQA